MAYALDVARAATTTDAFNALAEPRRRQVLDPLASGELPVNDLVARLDVVQPLVAGHLRVLREVGPVDVRDVGRLRMYRLNPTQLKRIQQWVKRFEQSWSESFDQMDLVPAELNDTENGDYDDK